MEERTVSGGGNTITGNYHGELLTKTGNGKDSMRVIIFFIKSNYRRNRLTKMGN